MSAYVDAKGFEGWQEILTVMLDAGEFHEDCLEHDIPRKVVAGLPLTLDEADTFLTRLTPAVTAFEKRRQAKADRNRPDPNQTQLPL